MAAALPDQPVKDAKRVQALVYEALERNQTLPVSLTSLTIQGGSGTRSSFLRAQVDDLLTKPYTVRTLLQALDDSAKKLNSFGIFNGVAFGLDLAAPQENLPGVVALEGTLRLQDAPTKRLRTGTDVGNGEVSAYASGSLLNVFGGAESLTIDANIGSQKRSSYIVNYSTPIKNSHLWRADLSGIASSSNKDWASHEEVIRGLRAKAVGPGAFGGTQEIGYEAFWRTVTGVKSHASESVRAEAGDSFKSSVFNTWTLDKRNDPLFPTQGFSIKLKNEVAGYLPNRQGDIQFMKGEVEGQVAQSFWKENFTISLTGRSGLLWSFMKDGKTSIVDRFVLGGANDVRGFYLNRMGPSDEEDSIGGEAYAAGGLSLFSRLPGVAHTSPLRLHLFANAGSLLGLNRENPRETIAKLFKEPSVAAGVGLIYKHPVARFELNFTLPIAARASEFPRKGFQFGLGMSFL
ncbi:surface antigen-domain-containing protein [Lipomyces tetrasporus]|uniref:Surface antigen-domain-containing protein n=1 Tax=Lipomyces tetrasporus TaxID=54092 RepID=A0AAD7QY85_9ASCO|nr:surface antigen-domain-containing protein [Lipomyces tetrasporus]KAJ8103206.1 surface antigen-domain-containing protein [Lipomyces tetrasporus]